MTMGYPIFIVYKELEQRGALLAHIDELDLIWEHCTGIYMSFVESDFNDGGKSEYQCIVEYLNRAL